MCGLIRSGFASAFFSRGMDEQAKGIVGPRLENVASQSGEDMFSDAAQGLGKSGEDNMSGAAEGMLSDAEQGLGSSGEASGATDFGEEETQAWSDSLCRDVFAYVDIECDAAQPVAMINWSLYSTTAAVEKHIDELFSRDIDSFIKGYIGIAINPCARATGWWPPRHFLDEGEHATKAPPHKLRFRHMDVIYVGLGSEVGLLERRLITKYWRNDRLENIRAGGEGSQPDHPTFLYWCWNSMSEAIEIGKARFKRSKR